MKTMNKILMIAAVLLAGACSKPGSADGTTGNADSNTMTNRPALFKTTADAAKAAQADMLAAIEQKVDFGVNMEALRKATPETEMLMMTLNPANLLNADSTTNFEKLSEKSGKMLVPFVSDGRVVAVAFLSQDQQQYKIAGLGDMQITTELAMLYPVFEKYRGTLQIIWVENLNTHVYMLKGDSMNNPQGGYIFSSYAGHNIREPLNEREFMTTLAKDARVFAEQFGEQLKKGQLVR